MRIFLCEFVLQEILPYTGFYLTLVMLSYWMLIPMTDESEV